MCTEKELGNADRVVASWLECGRVGSAFDEEEVLPFFDVVEYLDVFHGLAHVGVLVAPSAEHVRMSVDLQHLDRAEVVARLAGEYAFVFDFVFQQRFSMSKLVFSRRFSAFFFFASIATPKQPMSSGDGGTRISLSSIIAKASGMRRFWRRLPEGILSCRSCGFRRRGSGSWRRSTRRCRR